MKKYLERYDANVISVDWEPLARSPWYTSAAKNSRLVGKYTAEFIKFLVEEGGSTYDSFHVLGASLGAHAAGFVGHYSEVCKGQEISEANFLVIVFLIFAVRVFMGMKS